MQLSTILSLLLEAEHIGQVSIDEWREKGGIILCYFSFSSESHSFLFFLIAGSYQMYLKFMII